MPLIKRKPLVATMPERMLLAVDLSPRDYLRRARLINLGLMDVAIVGKDAVVAQPKVKDCPRRPRRTAEQIANTANATFRAKEAAALRRKRYAQAVA